MVNPTLYVNKAFIDQFQKCIKEEKSNTMFGIKKVLNKDNSCVIVIVMFYDNRTIDPMKVFREVVLYILSYRNILTLTIYFVNLKS